MAFRSLGVLSDGAPSCYAGKAEEAKDPAHRPVARVQRSEMGGNEPGWDRAARQLDRNL